MTYEIDITEGESLYNQAGQFATGSPEALLDLFTDDSATDFPGNFACGQAFVHQLGFNALPDRVIRIEGVKTAHVVPAPAAVDE